MNTEAADLSSQYSSNDNWKQVSNDNLFHYKNKNPDLITALVLNVLPANEEIRKSGIQGSQPYYVCVIYKEKDQSRFSQIFEKMLPKIEKNVVTQEVRRQEDVLFTVWSSAEQQKSRQYINNLLNTLCNPDVFEKDCLPSVIKEQFQKEINTLLTPPIEDEGDSFNLKDESWYLNLPEEKSQGIKSSSQESGSGLSSDEEEDPFAGFD